MAASLRGDYLSEARGERPSKRWLQDFNKEVAEISQYRGRETLELLQNADDARSRDVCIRLDKAAGLLEVTNSGPETLPFTNEGMESILFSNMSPKRSHELIGAKGLGFRSILNWSDHVEIKSGNMHAVFSREEAEVFWSTEMRRRLGEDEARRYEKESRNHGRSVPLALLALPRITEETGKPDETVIAIHLDRDAGRTGQIETQLRQFTPESLLFMHHVKSVRIDIDEETVGDYRNSVISSVNGVEESELNGQRWVKVSEKGEIESEGKTYHYEVACAFNRSGEREITSHPVYTFFPTGVYFGLPCILHATLELDSSRNSLITGSKRNELMMKRLAGTVHRLAEYLKTTKPSTWMPYRLMRPRRDGVTHEYEKILNDALWSAPGKYIPRLDNDYGTSEEVTYVNDDFFDIVERIDPSCIQSMRRKADAETSARLDDAAFPAAEEIEKFAGSIEDADTLAEAILALTRYAVDTDRKLNLDIFRDSRNRVIKGATYINTGMKAPELPPSRRFEYLGEDLEKALMKRMTLGRVNPKREMASRLSWVGDIMASDITSITELLLPKKQDERLTADERKEIIRCLFKLYKSREFEISDSEKGIVYLFDGNGDWRPAEKLVLDDSRFPGGFAAKGYSFRYKPEETALFPDFLLDVADSYELEEFYVKLGVRQYFVPEVARYGEDDGYKMHIGLSGDPLSRSTFNHVGDRNDERILPDGLIDRLGTEETLRLVIDSGYCREVLKSQKIHYFLNVLKPPVETDTSYAAYRLMRKLEDSGAGLSKYVIEDDSWLPGFEQNIDIPYRDKPEMKLMLAKVGAKQRLSDFTPKDLYDTVNRRAKAWRETRVETGFATFYHDVKMALDAMPHFDGIGDGVRLEMLCRIGDRLELRDSRQVYYSDRPVAESLAEHIPMVVMSKREGEQLVRKAFGCRPFSDLNFEITAPETNLALEKSFSSHLHGLKPILLAVVSENIGARGSLKEPYRASDRQLLERFEFKVVHRARYRIHVDGNPVEREMDENEVVYKDDTAYIRSTRATLGEALSDPGFVDAVIDVLCMAFKLSIKENRDRFYRIVRLTTARERAYYVNNEITQARFGVYEEAFGIPESEKAFWQEVFQTNGVEMNLAELERLQRPYIAEALGITHKRAVAEEFVRFHLDRLKKERLTYDRQYIWHVFERMKGDREQHPEFLGTVRQFTDGEWIERALGASDERLKTEFDYGAFMTAAIEREFGVRLEPGADALPVEPIGRYTEGIEKFGLSERDKSLLYFEGYDEHFAELRKRLSDDGDDEVEPAATAEGVAIDISEYELGAVEESRRQKRGDNPGRSRSWRRPSERRLKALGNRAEDIVHKALGENPRYEIGDVFSEHLNDKGDDSKGYDLEYRDTTKDETMRRLEIKHSDGSTVIISPNELSVAQSEPEIYDLALVVGDEVRILRAPFSDETKYTKRENDFTVTFKAFKS